MGQRLRRWRVTLRKVIRRVIYSESSTTSIAGGFTLGIFLGLTPTVGFQMIPAAFLAALFRVNILAAMLAVWITNPLTVAPIYYGEYLIGKAILPYEAGSDAAEGIARVVERFGEVSMVDLWHTVGAAIAEFLSLGNEIIVRLLIGSFALATVSATLAYPMSLWLVKYVRHRREMRAVRRADQRLALLNARGLVHLGGPTERAEGDSGEIPVPGARPPQIVALPVRAAQDPRNGPDKSSRNGSNSA